MKSKKKIWIGGGLIFAAALLAVGIGFLNSRGVLSYTKKVPGTYLAAESLAEQVKQRFTTGSYGYTYGEPFEGIKRNDTIEVPSVMNPEELGLEKWSGVLQLFEDPELKIPAYCNYEYDEERQTIVLKPSNYTTASIWVHSVSIDTARKYPHDDNYLFPQSAGEDWGNLSTLYLAVYYDLETGERLENPVVHVVSKEGEIAEAPSVNYSFTEDGRIILDWNPVPGAQTYFVCTIDYKEESGYESGARVIAITEDTTWMPEAPLYGSTTVNDGLFRMFEVCQDDWFNEYRAEKIKEEYGEEPVAVLRDDYYKNAICVFAVNEQGTSMMSNAVHTEEVASVLPYAVAHSTWKENGYTYSQYDTYEELPSYGYVTMCDGNTAVKLIHYDIERAAVIEDRYIYGDEEGNYLRGENVKVLKIPYIIEGTPFEDVFTVPYFQEEDFEAALNFLKDREEKLRKKSGGIQMNNNLDVRAEQTKPLQIRQIEDINITANSALSEYLARCMMSGTESINLSEFYEAADVYLVEDALLEAYYQNPLILGIEGYKIDGRKRTVYLAYENNPKKTAGKQEEIITKVMEITAEIISEDMTDLEKELAINEYLCNTIEYDEEALDNAIENDFIYVDERYNDSFNAYGALINGKCVCAGYAAAFKLLAEEAGLETIVVTGFLDGSYAHAWNKVNIEGEWQVVDVTNNDTDYLKNALFNLPDRAGDITLTEDRDYVIDTFVSSYDSVSGEKEFYRIHDKYFDYSRIAGELLAELKENGNTVLRTEYELDDDSFNRIAKQVARRLPRNQELYGFYWMGVIYMEVE